MAKIEEIYAPLERSRVGLIERKSSIAEEPGSSKNNNEDAAIVRISSKSLEKQSLRSRNSTESEEAKTTSRTKQQSAASKDTKLDEHERQELEKLKKRDQEVRLHEQAHLAALGAHRAGGAKFSYDVGPDGKSYAVSGEVPIDASKEESPEKTIEKARTIRRAALAPSDPSAADKAAAAQANKLEADAKKELKDNKAAKSSFHVTV
ncbi:MAG: hypothetical protein IT291_02135 [Deltaproteobacteria bacterium]|nr:hypothetical protein [Deltaproteobacteria bacterium]